MDADDVPTLFVAVCRTHKTFGAVRKMARFRSVHHGGDFDVRIVDARLPPETALYRRVEALRLTEVSPYRTSSMARNLSDHIRVLTGLRLAAG